MQHNARRSKGRKQGREDFQRFSLTLPDELYDYLSEFSARIKREGGYRIPRTVIIRAILKVLAQSDLDIDLKGIRITSKKMDNVRLASSEEVEEMLVGRLVKAFRK